MSNNSFDRNGLSRSAAIISMGTLCSRILGFLRDIVIARIFGLGTYAQAFVISFKIPNLLRDFVGEGATNAAFVPVFSEYNIRKTKEEFWELAAVVLNILLVVLMGITLLGVLLAPVIVRIIAPGFVASADKLNTTITLTRLIFPYILLIALTAYFMGLLNSLRHFFFPAFAPCLLNISIIIFSIVLGEGITALAGGILVGGLLQLMVQIPVLYKKGFRFRFFLRRFKHPAVSTIFRLMLPRLFSSGIYQLNNLVDSIFASFSWVVGEGAVAVLYFAYRLILFPIGIFSNAISQAVLPEFSHQALELDYKELKQTLSRSLRINFLVMLPVSVGFIALAYPLIATLFQGGRFDANSAYLTSRVLLFYSIGLLAYGANKILQSCFFALKDTLTPAKISAYNLVLNIVLNSMLMFPLKMNGLALATSVSSITVFLVLLKKLKEKIGDFNIMEIFDSLWRILLASICMGLVCYYVYFFITSFLNNKYLNLAISSLSGLSSYPIFCLVFKVKEIRQLRSLIKI